MFLLTYTKYFFVGKPFAFCFLRIQKQRLDKYLLFILKNIAHEFFGQVDWKFSWTIGCTTLGNLLRNREVIMNVATPHAIPKKRYDSLGREFALTHEITPTFLLRVNARRRMRRALSPMTSVCLCASARGDIQRGLRSTSQSRPLPPRALQKYSICETTRHH